MCVCSKSMLLKDVYVKLNRDKDVNYITTTLIPLTNSSTNNDKSFQLSALETQTFILFYLRSALLGLKTGQWYNETFIMERNGNCLIMDAKFNWEMPALWFFRFNEPLPYNSLVMSRESAIELYYFLQSIVDFNNEDYHSYSQHKIRLG